MADNVYYISQGMRVRKVSNRKCDLHGHSRSFALLPFQKPHDFLLVFHCAFSFTTSKILTVIFQNIKRCHITLKTSSLAVIYYACTTTPQYQLSYKMECLASLFQGYGLAPKFNKKLCYCKGPHISIFVLCFTRYGS